MVSSHVLEALREAVRHEGEIRLVTQGRKPEGKGLFPRRTKPYAQAIEMCLNVEKPLLEIIREEQKGKTITQLVKITPHGLQTLSEHTSPEEYEGLIKDAAPARQEELIEACVQASKKRLLEMATERDRLAEAQQRITEVLLQMMTERVEQLEGEKRQREERLAQTVALQKRLSGMLDTLAPVGGEMSASPPTPPATPPRTATEPRSEEDFDFQRDITENLVYAWQDVSNPETQQALERGLLNAGVERIGEPGQRVEIDGRCHHTEEDIFPGDPAEVVKPGWRLVNQRGNSLIAKARVKTVT
jgi:hypothetical protein